jgi:hypothetical protein
MSTVADRHFKQINWPAVVMFALGFWLSASLVIDSVIIPSLVATGMMNQFGFASTGYLIFGVFNRIELVCAAIVLSGFLVFRNNHNFTAKQEFLSVVLSSLLLGIALIYTYILTPQMSSLGLQLNLFDTSSGMPAAMVSLHEGYWFLEAIKFIVGATLLRWCYRNSCSLT